MQASIFDTILLTLQIAAWTTVLVMGFALLWGFWFFVKPSTVKKTVETCFYIPMAMPPVALGYGLLIIFGPNSALGGAFFNAFGINIGFSFAGAVLASCMVSLGIGVKTIRMALLAIDPAQIKVALTLGANKGQVFGHIIVPQCYRALFQGAVLVFIRAISEFGATMVLAGTTIGQSRTLALAIWVGMEMPGQERECMLLVFISIVLAIVALLSVEFLTQKHRENL